MPSLLPVLLCPLLVACVKLADRLKEFSERVIDAAASNIEGCLEDEIPDITGQFYLAIEPIIAQGLYLEFIVDAEFSEDAGAVTGDFSVQPLCVHSDCGADLLQPLGDPIVASDVLVDGNCSFTAELNDITVPGNANPISGSPIIGDITLLGVVRSTDLFCGDVVGTLQAPIPNLSLDGSTFGAKRIEPGTLGEDLPTRIFKCPSLMPMPDAGMPDAATPDAGVSDADIDAS